MCHGQAKPGWPAVPRENADRSGGTIRALDGRRRAVTRAVIELAGPAGAGKTTLARALRDADPATSIGLTTGGLRMARGLAVMAPTLTASWLSAPERFWSRDELRSLVYLTAWQAQIRAFQEPGLAVLDHGPVFRLTSLAAYGPPMTDTAVFHRRWYRLAEQWGRLLDVVVWLDAPDDVLLNRINARDREHRIRGAAQAEAESFLARYRAAYRTTIAAVTREGARLVALDTTACPPEQLAAAVRAAVLGTPSRRSP
jgi:thymidylate kinase